MGFELKSYAKWILSGEHTVVAGGKAIAFPLRNFSFTAECDFSYSGFKKEVIIESENKEFLEIVQNLIETAMTFFRIKPFYPSYKIRFFGNIPIKCGLGSSAAICVLVSRIVAYLIPDFKFNHVFLFSVAKILENNFHGKSSGLDIAVTLYNKPIIFENGAVKETFSVESWPVLGLSYSGKQSITSLCARKVQQMRNENTKYAQELDNSMNESANMCELALRQGDLHLLRAGIELGCDVFRKWGLINDSLDEHIKFLKSKGALAVKPIGSGFGGYVVSLWPEKNEVYKDICLTLENP